MSPKSGAERTRWVTLPFGLALLGSVWGSDMAAAADSPGTNLGTVNFTLTTYPGAPTSPGGGGPFEMTFSGGSSPTNLLSGLGIPANVMTWCVDLNDTISPGTLNTGATLYNHVASELGGMLAAGLKWLNVVNTGGTSGTVSLTAAGSTEFSSFTSESNPWTALQISAAFQDVIWSLQGLHTLPSSIGSHSAADFTNLVNLLETYANNPINQSAYFWLVKPNLQTQVFTLPPGSSTFGVPGPVAGAGLPGLLLACGWLVALARRRRKVA